MLNQLYDLKTYENPTMKSNKFDIFKLLRWYLLIFLAIWIGTDLFLMGKCACILCAYICVVVLYSTLHPTKCCHHYSDVIMGAIASLITSLAVVYSAVYSDADQRKHQSSASLVFVWGIHRDRWIPRTKGQLRGKCFHLMTSSCKYVTCTLQQFLN